MTTPSSKIVRGVGRHRRRRLAADVGHVPEHRRPADDPALVEDRHDDQPVVGVADRGAAGVRVGGEQDVALLDRAVEAVEEVGDGQAELADDHLPVGVGDQRELVVLLADARRQRGAEQHLVHLVAGVAQRVLDQVEGDRVDVDAARAASVAVSMIRAMAQPSGRVDGTDEEAAGRVHGGRVPGQDQGGGVHLGDDRRDR